LLNQNVQNCNSNNLSDVNNELIS